MVVNETYARGWSEDAVTLEEALKKWPVAVQPERTMAVTTDKPNSRSVLAFLMWWLPRDSDRYCSLTLEDQKEEYEALRRTFMYKLPDWAVLAPIDLVSPVWNHPGDIIPEAEKCCRAFALLRCHFSKISKATFGENKLPMDKKFDLIWSKQDVFKSQVVENVNKPVWMREFQLLGQPAVVKKIEPKASQVRPRTIRFKQPPSSKAHATQLGILWRDREARDELSEERKACQESLDRLDVPCRYDPRDFRMREELWRDLIRVDLKLADLKWWIGSLATLAYDVDGEPCMESFYRRVGQGGKPWEAIL